MMQSGVYTITSPSGGQYVGSAVNFDNRWRVHRHLLKKGKHNRAFQRAANKYGVDSFRFDILLVCDPRNNLMYEQRAIDVLKPKYNGRMIAASMLGYKHRPESNEKNAAAHRGKKLTNEHKRKISLLHTGNKYNIGKRLPICHKENIAKSLRGKPHADSFFVMIKRSEIEDIVRRYTGGCGVTRLASNYKVSHKTIRKILNKNGIDAHPRGGRIKQNGS